MMIGCFFPTRVLFLDDNSNHLNSIAAEINEYKTIPLLFNNSIDALRYLQNDYHPQPFSELFLSTPEDHEFSRGMFDIDIRGIHKIITNPQRFREISVLVSDYSMPDMHGIAFLEKIKNTKMKKIMLTGEAEAILAVKAFNNNLIQKFIRKDVGNFTKELNSCLDQLQESYFNDLTKIALDSVIADENCRSSCLNQLEYPPFFEEVRQKLNAVEYYLLDEDGSCLLADFTGNLTIVAVKSQDSLQAYGEFAKEEGADDNILAALAEKKMLPFFYSAADLNTPPSDWAKCLYPAIKAAGSDNIYYSIITDVKRHLPDLGKVTSFKDYLDQLDSYYSIG